MRKQDIKPGVVYAYRRGAWDTPTPLVFLSLDLHVPSRQRKPGDPWCERALHDKRAKRGSIYPDVGYPVVIGERMGQGATEETIAAMPALGADVIADGLTDEQRASRLSTDILTRLASVVGVYAEVMAERKRQVDKDREVHRRHAEQTVATQARRAELMGRLAAVGVTVTRVYDHDDQLILTLDEAAKVAGWLED